MRHPHSIVYALAGLLSVLLIAACADGDDDDSTTNTVAMQTTESTAALSDKPPTCSAAGAAFSTDLASCEDAMTVAAYIVDPLGRATPEGVEVMVGTMCSAIQQTDVEMTSTREDIQLAERLSSEGVCPGDTSILIPKD